MPLILHYQLAASIPERNNQMKFWKLLLSVLGTVASCLYAPKAIAQQDSLAQIETNEVQIKETKSSLSTDFRSVTMNTNMGKGEFLKAACCNLSESFETNPSVDVNFTDAVTGTKQILMLGLTGNYISLQSENIPEVRGLNANQGLGFIPGPWIKSIQITKGPGSVVNGFESMAGAMNIEQQKPDGAEQLLLNGYYNYYGRAEANMNFAKKINSQFSTGTMLHADAWQKPFDRNQDGFMDMPMNKTLSIAQRFKLTTSRLILQAGARAVNDQRWGGQMDFNPEQAGSKSIYGTSLKFAQIQVWSKAGYMFPNQPYRSIGLISNYTWQQSKNWFGLTQYNGLQRSLYLNSIYQDIWGSTINSYKTGISFQSDYFNEQLFQNDTIAKKRTEQVTGIYYEHTYSPLPQWTFLAGIRADYNNLYGSFITPRMHAKWDINALSSLRVLIGRGQKSANIIAENLGYLASSRQVLIRQSATAGFGLRPEVSWTYGASYNHDFTLFDQKGSVTIDAFYTQFQNQVVVDLENPRQISFYNLNNKSYSKSAQIEANYKPHRRFEIRLAYRFNEVKIAYNEESYLSKPFVARDRFLFNAAYETRSHWKFDLTVNIIGTKRIPNSDGLARTNSPWFPTVNSQITKVFKQQWEVYAGVENLTDFRQTNAIVSASQPFSSNFDASYIWGNMLGRNVYVGFRYSITSKN